MGTMRSQAATRKTPTQGKAALMLAAAGICALALTSCGGASANSANSAKASNGEWPGKFTVANGDSEFYVGGGPYEYEKVTAMCSGKDGALTVTLSETVSGNSFTTTQPEGGSGYAGGTLTLGDGSTTFTWVPREGITEDDILSGESVFEDPTQDGSPAIWNNDGSLTFGGSINQSTTKVEDGVVSVFTPGEILCSEGAS